MSVSRIRRGAAVVLCGTAVVIAAACPQPGKRPATRRTTPPDSAGQVMFGVRAPLTHLGESKGILVADSGFVYDDGLSIALHRVTLTFISEQGVDVAVLTGREALYSLADSRVEFDGSIEIVGLDGRKLTTGSLVFDVARNRLVGDSSYVFSGAGAKASATPGFVADPALTRVLSQAAQRKLDDDSVKAAAAKAAKAQAAKAPSPAVPPKSAARETGKAASAPPSF